MYLPSSSSVLNPIELCWGTFKKQLGRRLADIEDHEALVHIDLAKYVQECLEDYEGDTNGIDVAYSALKKYLICLDGSVV